MAIADQVFPFSVASFCLCSDCSDCSDCFACSVYPLWEHALGNPDDLMGLLGGRLQKG